MPLRVLVCVEKDRSATLLEHLGVPLRNAEVVMATGGCEAVERLLEGTTDAVVIDGGIDGCDGLRVAGAVARYRPGPMLLLVDDAAETSVRTELRLRDLRDAQVMGREHAEQSPGALRAAMERLLGENLSQGPVVTLRPELQAVAQCPVDAIVLLGSAGTPHMLPNMLPKLSPDALPLVVGVHHNPRLSASFRDWISEMAGVGAGVLGQGMSGLPPVSVALADEDVSGLQPNLDLVMWRVLRLGIRPLVIVASGMQFEAIGAVRHARDKGGPLVALVPDECPQPAMVHDLIAGGLSPVLGSQTEIAALIAAVSEHQEPRRLAS